MKIRISLIFLFAVFASLAQTDTSSSQRPPGFLKRHHCAVNLGYGKVHGSSAGEFADYFTSNHNQEYAKELHVFGLNLITPMWISKDSSALTPFNSNMGINYRHTGRLEINDSTYYTLGAMDVSLALGYDLFRSSKNVDLVFRAGFDIGMTALNLSGKWYRNPFLDAIVQVNPRILLGPVAFSFKAEFGFDLSSQSWKPYGISDDFALKQHYRMMFFSVGYVFR